MRCGRQRSAATEGHRPTLAPRATVLTSSCWHRGTRPCRRHSPTTTPKTHTQGTCTHAGTHTTHATPCHAAPLQALQAHLQLRRACGPYVCQPRHRLVLHRLQRGHGGAIKLLLLGGVSRGAGTPRRGRNACGGADACHGHEDIECAVQWHACVHARACVLCWWASCDGVPPRRACQRVLGCKLRHWSASNPPVVNPSQGQATPVPPPQFGPPPRFCAPRPVPPTHLGSWPLPPWTRNPTLPRRPTTKPRRPRRSRRARAAAAPAPAARPARRTGAASPPACAAPGAAQSGWRPAWRRQRAMGGAGGEQRCG